MNSGSSRRLPPKSVIGASSQSHSISKSSFLSIPHRVHLAIYRLRGSTFHHLVLTTRIADAPCRRLVNADRHRICISAVTDQLANLVYLDLCNGKSYLYREEMRFYRNNISRTSRMDLHHAGASRTVEIPRW